MKVGIWEGFPEEVMQSEFLMGKDVTRKKKKRKEGRRKKKKWKKR